MPNHKRVLELALKGLEAERQRIDEEMKEIRRQLGGGTITKSASAQPTRMTSGTKRKMSAAARAAISKRMRQIWAERRAA